MLFCSNCEKEIDFSFICKECEQNDKHGEVQNLCGPCTLFHHLKNYKQHLNSIYTLCEECEECESTIYCASCEQYLCKSCDSKIHNKGKRARHIREESNHCLSFQVRTIIFIDSRNVQILQEKKQELEIFQESLDFSKEEILIYIVDFNKQSQQNQQEQIEYMKNYAQFIEKLPEKFSQDTLKEIIHNKYALEYIKIFANTQENKKNNHMTQLFKIFNENLDFLKESKEFKLLKIDLAQKNKSKQKQKNHKKNKQIHQIQQIQQQQQQLQIQQQQSSEEILKIQENNNINNNNNNNSKEQKNTEVKSNDAIRKKMENILDDLYKDEQQYCYEDEEDDTSNKTQQKKSQSEFDMNTGLILKQQQKSYTMEKNNKSYSNTTRGNNLSMNNFIQESQGASYKQNGGSLCRKGSLGQVSKPSIINDGFQIMNSSSSQQNSYQTDRILNKEDILYNTPPQRLEDCRKFNMSQKASDNKTSFQLLQNSEKDANNNTNSLKQPQLIEENNNTSPSYSEKEDNDIQQDNNNNVNDIDNNDINNCSSNSSSPLQSDQKLPSSEQNISQEKDLKNQKVHFSCYHMGGVQHNTHTCSMPFPVFQNFKKCEIQNSLKKSYDLQKELQKMAEQGQLLLSKSDFTKFYSAQFNIGIKQADDIIKEALQQGIIHQTTRIFDNNEQVDMISLYLEYLSLESLIWIIKNIKQDRMTATEKVILSRMKECFALKLTPSSWNMIIQHIEHPQYVQQKRNPNDKQPMLPRLIVKQKEQDPLIGIETTIVQLEDESEEEPEDFGEVDKQSTEWKLFLDFLDSYFQPSKNNNNNVVSTQNAEKSLLNNSQNVIPEQEGQESRSSSMVDPQLIKTLSDNKNLTKNSNVSKEQSNKNSGSENNLDLNSQNEIKQSEDPQQQQIGSQKSLAQQKNTGKQVSGNEIRTIPGGRYGCAQYVKFCGPKELQALSLGKLSLFVQEAINQGIIWYYRTLLVQSVIKEDNNSQMMTESHLNALQNAQNYLNNQNNNINNTSIFTQENSIPNVELSAYTLQREAKIKTLQEALIEVLRENIAGIALPQIPQYLKKKIHFQFNLQDLGYPKLKNFIATVPEVKIELAGTTSSFAVLKNPSKYNNTLNLPTTNMNPNSSEFVPSQVLSQSLLCTNTNNTNNNNNQNQQNNQNMNGSQYQINILQQHQQQQNMSMSGNINNNNNNNNVNVSGYQQTQQQNTSQQQQQQYFKSPHNNNIPKKTLSNSSMSNNKIFNPFFQDFLNDNNQEDQKNQKPQFKGELDKYLQKVLNYIQQILKENSNSNQRGLRIDSLYEKLCKRLGFKFEYVMFNCMNFNSFLGNFCEDILDIEYRKNTLFLYEKNTKFGPQQSNNSMNYSNDYQHQSQQQQQQQLLQNQNQLDQNQMMGLFNQLQPQQQNPQFPPGFAQQQPQQQNLTQQQQQQLLMQQQKILQQQMAQYNMALQPPPNMGPPNMAPMGPPNVNMGPPNTATMPHPQQKQKPYDDMMTNIPYSQQQQQQLKLNLQNSSSASNLSQKKFFPQKVSTNPNPQPQPPTPTHSQTQNLNLPSHNQQQNLTQQQYMQQQQQRMYPVSQNHLQIQPPNPNPWKYLQEQQFSPPNNNNISQSISQSFQDYQQMFNVNDQSQPISFIHSRTESKIRGAGGGEQESMMTVVDIMSEFLKGGDINQSGVVNMTNQTFEYELEKSEVGVQDKFPAKHSKCYSEDFEISGLSQVISQKKNTMFAGSSNINNLNNYPQQQQQPQSQQQQQQQQDKNMNNVNNNQPFQ